MSLNEQTEKEQAAIQSRAFVFSICLCAALSVCFVLHYAAGACGGRAIVLEDKINPNTETAVSMARLPSFGQAKAMAIVEYRNGPNVFERADDLDKVKGIGPKTVENIRPYLKFE